MTGVQTCALPIFLGREYIHVIVSDYEMPTLSGIEFLTIVSKEYPTIRRVLLSGHLNLEVALLSINKADVHKVVTKPWDSKEFIKVIKTQINVHLGKRQRSEDYNEMRELIISNPTMLYYNQEDIITTLLELSTNEKIENLFNLLLSAIEGILSLISTIVPVFIESKDRIYSTAIDRYLDDVGVISNQFNQKQILTFVYLFKTYMYRYTGESEKSLLFFKNTLRYYDDLDETNPSSEILIEGIDLYQEHFMSDNEEHPINVSDKICSVIVNRLAAITVSDLIVITKTTKKMIISSASKIKYFFVTNNDIPIYMKYGIDETLNISLISAFVSALDSFFAEITATEGDFETIHHQTAVIYFHKIENFKYRSEERRVGKECRSRWSP